MKLKSPATKVEETSGVTLSERGRKVVNRGAAAVGAVAVAASAYGGQLLKDRVEYVTRAVSVPPASGEYKQFYVGETFNVGGKEVRITSLEQAAQLAGLPDVTSQATESMLLSQLPENMQPTEIPDTIEFRLPVTAQFGDLHTGE